eukprot:gb/GFBE01080401.1/.p1 GENE.gb/GFBE01080401.1/~~gb/GFBE01080401.1/.p1  ORF type:complete len:241 (+),score=30.98 gb/GFBE01080401.1/:1-723(+)
MAPTMSSSPCFTRGRSPYVSRPWLAKESIDRTPSPECLYSRQAPQAPLPAPMAMAFTPVVFLQAVPVRPVPAMSWHGAAVSGPVTMDSCQKVPTNGADLQCSMCMGEDGGLMSPTLSYQTSAADSKDTGVETPRLMAGGQEVPADTADKQDGIHQLVYDDNDGEANFTADERSFSFGSVGHSEGRCAAACKYAAKARGCKDGAECDRCHICKFSNQNTSWGIKRNHMWARRRKQQLARAN